MYGSTCPPKSVNRRWACAHGLVCKSNNACNAKCDRQEKKHVPSAVALVAAVVVLAIAIECDGLAAKTTRSDIYKICKVDDTQHMTENKGSTNET